MGRVSLGLPILIRRCHGKSVCQFHKSSVARADSLCFGEQAKCSFARSNVTSEQGAPHEAVSANDLLRSLDETGRLAVSPVGQALAQPADAQCVDEAAAAVALSVAGSALVHFTADGASGRRSVALGQLEP